VLGHQIQQLLDGKIVLTPTTTGDGAILRGEANFTLGRSFQGILCSNGVASPTGFRRVAHRSAGLGLARSGISCAARSRHRRTTADARSTCLGN